MAVSGAIGRGSPRATLAHIVLDCAPPPPFLGAARSGGLPGGGVVGYSGTPLAQKLGIKPDHRVLVIGGPPGCRRILGCLPTGVRFTKRAGPGLDLVHLFVDRRATLR